MDTTRQDREKQVKQALANGALEGLKPNPQFRALLDRYVAGEISLDDAIEYTKAQFQQQQNTESAVRED
jgi:phage shock protein A